MIINQRGTTIYDNDEYVIDILAKNYAKNKIQYAVFEFLPDKSCVRYEN